MAKASSIHFCAAKNSADKHNKREKDLDYVRKELEENLPLEKWCWEHPDYSSVAKMRKQAEKEYFSKEITVTGNHGTYVTHRSMPKNAEPVKEGVVAINQNVTMEQLRAFGEWTRQEYGITPMAIYIHLGEGHWAPLDEKEGQTEDMYRRDDGHEWKRVNELGETEYWKPNLHAHMVYDWFDHESKRCFNLGPSVMRRMEDELPKFLNMERGIPSDRKWLNSIAFKSKKVRERAAQEKQRIFSDIDKWKQEAEAARIEAEVCRREVAKQHKAMNSLQTMIANLKTKLEKGEGDAQELEAKIQDKQAKLEVKEKAYSDAVGRLGVAEKKEEDIMQRLSRAAAEFNQTNTRIAENKETISRQQTTIQQQREDIEEGKKEFDEVNSWFYKKGLKPKKEYEKENQRLSEEMSRLKENHDTDVANARENGKREGKEEGQKDSMKALMKAANVNWGKDKDGNPYIPSPEEVGKRFAEHRKNAMAKEQLEKEKGTLAQELSEVKDKARINDWLIREVLNAPDKQLWNDMKVYFNSTGWRCSGNYAGIEFNHGLGRLEDAHLKDILTSTLKLPYDMATAADSGLRETVTAMVLGFISAEAPAGGGGGGGSDDNWWKRKDEDWYVGAFKSIFHAAQVQLGRPGGSRKR